jgi:plastocyanin
MVVCSLGAAAIHLSVVGQHSLIEGLAFLAMALFQGAWAGAAILLRHPLVLLAGAAGNGLILAGWLVTRTGGLPFGPEAGIPQPAGFKDVTATVLELVIIGGAFLLLLPDAAARFRRRVLPRGWVPMALGAAMVLATAAVLVPHAHTHAGPGHDLAAPHGHGEDGGHEAGDEQPEGDHPDEAAGHDEGTEHEDGHGDDDAAGEGTHSSDHDDADGSGGQGHGGHGDDGHGDDGHGDDPGDGGAPGQEGEESNVVAGPFAESAGYATPTVTMEAGGRVSFTNLDSVLHDVVHDAEADGFGGPQTMPWCGQGHHSEGPCPVFWTPLIGSGQTTGVWGLKNTEPGRTYSFFCTLHHGMTGTLTVSQAPQQQGRAY